jgi:hypothetical protein
MTYKVDRKHLPEVTAMNRFSVIFGISLIAWIVAAQAPCAWAQTAEEIIAKNIKAQGGREALLGLKAIERKGNVSVDGTFGQMEGSVEEVAVPWKKARRALDLAVFIQKDGWNGKLAWRDGQMGIQDLEGEEANQIKQSAELNPFVMIGERGTKAEKLDDETIEDVPYYVIQLSPKDRPVVKFLIDKKTDLVRSMSLTQKNPQFGEAQVVVQSSDYEKFGPVTLPTKTKVSIGEVLEIATTFTETKIDGDVDQAVFEKPKDEGK